jgi:hypothetical protein
MAEAARDRCRRSSAPELSGYLRSLDFGNQAMLLGAGLLSSLLPFMILLSGFASERVDDSIVRRMGLSGHAEVVVRHLFHSAPASLNIGTVLGLLFMFAGTFAVASSLQQIYEKILEVDHRGMRDWLRLVLSIVVLCALLAIESLMQRPAREVARRSDPQ